MAMIGPAAGAWTDPWAHLQESGHEFEPEWPGFDVDRIPAGNTHLAALQRVTKALRRL